MFIILFKYCLIPLFILLLAVIGVAVYNYRDEDGYDIVGVKKD